ncbi:unnamed protein product [Sphagnum jensenii]|uniref:HMA domain-containing protein n=1 Tax=Sphagnum jensenii TaxID=128206 RepID=A0ABP1B854_9BRYO
MLATATLEEVVVLVVMHCEGCAEVVRRAVRKISGVLSYTVDFPGQKVTLVGNLNKDEVLRRIRRTGKRATIEPKKEEPKKEEAAKPAEEAKPEEKKEEAKPEEPKKEEPKVEEPKKEEEKPKVEDKPKEDLWTPRFVTYPDYTLYYRYLY